MFNDNINILYLIEDLQSSDSIKSNLDCNENEFNIIFVANIEDFILRLNELDIDLIVSDFNVSGMEVLKIAKKINQDIPFIFISENINEEIVMESLESGAVDFISINQMKRLIFSIYRALNEKKEITKRLEVESKLKKSFEKLLKTFDQIVASFSSFAEKKDPYTAGHQKNVSLISCAIADELGYDPERIEGIRISSLLHDIGKIYVPSEFLNKPGILNEYEFNIVKSHTLVGYEILKEIQFPWPVPLFVLQHHERLNGSGYPEGLSEKRILNETKVISVADVVEAMVSHRPHRPSLGLDVALDEINTNKGILYDTNTVEACIKIFTKDGFYFKKIRDEIKI